MENMSDREETELVSNLGNIQVAIHKIICVGWITLTTTQEYDGKFI